MGPHSNLPLCPGDWERGFAGNLVVPGVFCGVCAPLTQAAVAGALPHPQVLGGAVEGGAGGRAPRGAAGWGGERDRESRIPLGMGGRIPVGMGSRIPVGMGGRIPSRMGGRIPVGMSGQDPIGNVRAGSHWEYQGKIPVGMLGQDPIENVRARSHWECGEQDPMGNILSGTLGAGSHWECWEKDPMGNIRGR